MTDEESLLALACGEDGERATAYEHLAETWLPRLIVIFERQLPPDVAGQAATGALMRLRRVARDSPGELPDADGLGGWLFSGGLFEAADAQRRIRGRQRAVVEGLEGHQDEVEADATEGDAVVDRAADMEFANSVLAFIFGLDQPARGILLYDMFDYIEELTGRELDLHNERLIDCGTSCGTWTPDALRSHRTRARKDLIEYLIMRGFREYLKDKGLGEYLKEKGYDA